MLIASDRIRLNGYTKLRQCALNNTLLLIVLARLMALLALTDVSLRCSEVSGVEGIALPFPIRIPNGRYQG